MGIGKIAPKIVDFHVEADASDGSRKIRRSDSVDIDSLDEIDGFASAELDGDGSPDLVLWDDSTQQIAVLGAELKLANVKSNPLYQGSNNAGHNPLHAGRTIGVGDLDGDGLPDLIGAVGDDVYIAPSLKGSTDFGPRTKVAVAGPSPSDVWVTPGDMDGDGAVELVAASGQGVYILDGPRSPEDGGIQKFAWTQVSGPIKWMAPESIRLADINGDRRMDIVLTGDSTSPLAPPRVFILLSSLSSDGRLTFNLINDPGAG